MKKVAVGILLLVVAVVAYGALDLLLPHTIETPTPLSLADARHLSPIPLPTSAINIHVAEFRHWQQLIQYVRFEAPLADCEAQARLLMPGAVPVAFDGSGDTLPPFNPGAFHDISWFDLKSVSNGETYGTAGPGEPIIHIDKARGIFYYRLTD